MGTICIKSVSWKVDIFLIGSKLESKGWSVSPGNGIPIIFCTITETNLKKMPEFVKETGEALDEVIFFFLKKSV